MSEFSIKAGVRFVAGVGMGALTARWVLRVAGGGMVGQISVFVLLFIAQRLAEKTHDRFESEIRRFDATPPLRVSDEGVRYE